ncbi:hypothetical protein GCM10027403_05160 [Arthrobacter tecti]
MGRPDVAVLGLPLAVAASSGWAALLRSGGRRPSQNEGQPATFRIEEARTDSDGGRRTFHVVSDGPPGAALIEAVAPGRPAVSALIPVGGPYAVSVPVPRSGRARVLSVGAAVVSLDGIMRQSPTELDPVHLTVLPRVTETRLLPLPFRLRGHTGEHTSRNSGDGGELRSIDAFRPGDQLRRIDWRATARQSADQDRLFVRRTYAHSEAGVHLLLDTAFDYPSHVRAWFPVRSVPVAGEGSLHLSREAATRLAASYLSVGDKVGLNELSGRHWPLRAAGGRRQLEIIRTHLALMAASPRRDRASREAGVPAGSLVYVFSPFTDEEPARLMRAWQAAGHRVIGVDTFPVLEGTAASPSGRRAVKLVLLQRRQVLNGLAADGVPVFGYRGERMQPEAETLDTLPGQLPLDVGLATLRGPARPGARAVGGRA